MHEYQLPAFFNRRFGKPCLIDRLDQAQILTIITALFLCETLQEPLE